MRGTSSSSRRLELNPSATEGQRRPRIRSTGYRLGLSATLPGLDNNDSDTNKPHPQSSTKPSMPQFGYIIPVVQLGQKCMLISMVKKWYNLQHSSVCLKNHYLSRCRFFTHVHYITLRFSGKARLPVVESLQRGTNYLLTYLDLGPPVTYLSSTSVHRWNLLCSCPRDSHFSQIFFERCGRGTIHLVCQLIN